MYQAFAEPNVSITHDLLLYYTSLYSLTVDYFMESVSAKLSCTMMGHETTLKCTFYLTSKLIIAIRPRQGRHDKAGYITIYINVPCFIISALSWSNGSYETAYQVGKYFDTTLLNCPK